MKYVRGPEIRRGGIPKIHRTEMTERRAFLLGYKLLMSGNQSFNEYLYVPLTRAAIPCPSQLHIN
jgi:hypothetical protein